ncbi:hypothetical protein AB0M20_34770, partial [Actinoplanes sp. NPDC051633]|uniref:hypothetical protein n=1 Tax=Actinoplanes sp. NPDC051633 TaxID=3155670 RepID=UPI0034172B8E
MSDADPSERLLSMALSRPGEASREADRILAGRPDPCTASIARQARAIVLRDGGHSAAAIAELRRALRAAMACGQPARIADVRATLGLSLGLAGRTGPGLAMLDAAIEGSRGVQAGTILVRRAILLVRLLGRYEEALEDLRRAIGPLRKGGERVWEARAHMARGLAFCALGQAARADRELVEAERLYHAVGQELESAHAIHNRAELAYFAGDLAAALRFLDAATERYATLGVYVPELGIDRCKVLLAAGLFTEAVSVAEAAIRQHTTRGGDAARTAELLFVAGQAAYGAGRHELAADRAAAARDIFRRTDRDQWHARASFVVLQSRWAAGHRDGRMARRAGDLADRLDDMDALETPAAHLLAGRLAAERGRLADADRHLARAADFRNRGPSFGHAAGWLAHAMRARQRGDTAAMLAACRFGLRAADNHRRTLAAPELRAHAAF